MWHFTILHLSYMTHYHMAPTLLYKNILCGIQITWHHRLCIQYNKAEYFVAQKLYNTIIWHHYLMESYYVAPILYSITQCGPNTIIWQQYFMTSFYVSSKLFCTILCVTQTIWHNTMWH